MRAMVPRRKAGGFGPWGLPHGRGSEDANRFRRPTIVMGLRERTLANLCTQAVAGARIPPASADKSFPCGPESR